MLLQLGLFLGSFAVGIALQHARNADRLRDLMWVASFWTLTPLIVLVTFLRLELDATLLRALAAAVIAAWAVIGLGYVYAYAVTRARDERGALVLGAAFGNTGFIGYPLAQLAFGQTGFSLAVLYDRLTFVLPMTSVSTVIARLHGRREVDVSRDDRRRAIVLNPPAWALVAALALRAAGVHPQLDSVSRGLAYAISGFGFLLLGIALPLDRIEHDGPEVARAAGACAVKFALSPLVLYLCGRLLGADIPPTFYLMAAMPVGFHLLILARVYDVRPALMRLLVVGSTVPGVIAVALGVALFK